MKAIVRKQRAVVISSDAAVMEFVWIELSTVTVSQTKVQLKSNHTLYEFIFI